MFKIKRISSGDSSGTGSGTNSINQMIDFGVGEQVKIVNDEEFLANKQKSCGGYSKKLMGNLLGQVVVVKNSKPNCITVEWCGKTYDLHPEVLHSLNEVKQKQDPIFDAVRKNDVQLLRQVITVSNIRIKNENKRTPLNLACVYGNSKEFIQELLECGSSVTEKDEFENSAWENSIKYERTDILEIILEYIKDNPDLRDIVDILKKELPSEPTIPEPPRLPESIGPMSVNFGTIPYPSNPTIPFNTTYSNTQGQNYNPELICSNASTIYPYDQRTICKICCDREIDTSVDCGHVFCRICVERLQPCPYCKRDILNKRPLFLS